MACSSTVDRRPIDPISPYLEEEFFVLVSCREPSQMKMVNTRSKRVSIATVLSAVFFAGGHDSLVGISAFAPAPAALMRVSSAPASRGTHQTLSMTRKDDGLTDEERQVKMDKALKAMRAFSNKYIEKTDTKYCTDMSVPAVVIKGLAEHKVALGAPLCPCRFYDDKEKEVKEGYWNCPCVPMRETKTCHCMLFLTEDNAFAGEQTVSRPDLLRSMSMISLCTLFLSNHIVFCCFM